MGHPLSGHDFELTRFYQTSGLQLPPVSLHLSNSLPQGVLSSSNSSKIIAEQLRKLSNDERHCRIKKRRPLLLKSQVAVL